MPPQVRLEEPGDVKAIRAVHEAAFGRADEGLLVDALRGSGEAALSLVAEDETEVVGHILFSRMTIEHGASSSDALALAPVAVLPPRQNQGIGSALIREGLRRVADSGHRVVLVVGHAAYYPRFGFSAALARRLSSPYAGDSFMALELQPGALQHAFGAVKYPRAFEML